MSADVPWEELVELTSREGHFILGAAEISDLHEHFQFGAGIKLNELTHAISIAYPLNTSVIDEIEDGPTILYKQHYRQVNAILDRTTTLIAAHIQHKGGRALSVPASVFVGWKTQAAHLSHKMIAVRAGVGWVGRNVLLITPEYGARVRLATILTDVPLKPAPRPRGDCGNCVRCVSSCPVGAINTGPHDFDLLVCANQNKYFEQHGMSVRICGICVKSCKSRA